MAESPDIQFGTLILRDTGVMWTLDADFIVTLKHEAILNAPKGTFTDGASIPRLFWRLIGSPLTGRYRQAAVIHDAGYTNQLQWLTLHLPHKYTRKEMDLMFLKLMKALGVSWWRRKAMYRAVRWFGGGHWTKR